MTTRLLRHEMGLQITVNAMWHLANGYKCTAQQDAINIIKSAHINIWKEQEKV